MKALRFFQGKRGDLIGRLATGKVVLPSRQTPISQPGVYGCEIEQRATVAIATIKVGPLVIGTSGMPGALQLEERVQGYGRARDWWVTAEAKAEAQERERIAAEKQEAKLAAIHVRHRERDEAQAAVHRRYEAGELTGEEANKLLAEIG